MDGAHGAVRWGVSTVERGNVRFRVAYNADEPSEKDPVAAAYRAGTIEHLGPLLDLAAAVVRPGDRVLDLGAHLGGFALAAASLGCEVIAVEASPQNAALLRRSAEENRFANLKVVHAAVADRAGSIEFIAQGPWGIVAPAAGAATVSVPAVRVDDLLAEHGWPDVRFVKIDVEGSEVAAVRGMPRLLGRPDAPVVFFESNQFALNLYGLTDADLKAAVRRHGYDLYRPGPGGLVPSSEGERQADVVVDYVAAKRVPAAVRRAA